MSIEKELEKKCRSLTRIVGKFGYTLNEANEQIRRSFMDKSLGQYRVDVEEATTATNLLNGDTPKEISNFVIKKAEQVLTELAYKLVRLRENK